MSRRKKILFTLIILFAITSGVIYAWLFVDLPSLETLYQHATAASTKSNRAHLIRFVLLGIYSGTRPGVLPKLRWTPSDDCAWVDLERGWIYRRGRKEAPA